MFPSPSPKPQLQPRPAPHESPASKPPAPLFQTPEGPRTVTVKEHALVLLPSRERVPLPCPDLPTLVTSVCDAVIVSRPSPWRSGH